MSIVSKIGRRINPKNFSYYSQRTILRPGLRDSVSNILSSRLPKGEINPKLKSQVETLKKDGILDMPDALNATQIGEITEWMKQQPLLNPYKADMGKFTYDQAPEGCHIGQLERPNGVNCPYLLRLANDPVYVGIATEFLGCKPTISHATCWWSFANEHKAMEAELFHRDVDDWKFVKLFIYLTEVDNDSGPHIYVKGSAGSNQCLKIRRYEDAEMEQAFGKENILNLTGHAGRTFMENTYGFHKGTPPRKKNRLLMQIQYSIFPIFAYKYSPVPIADIKADLKGVNLDPYMNRLFVKQ